MRNPSLNHEQVFSGLKALVRDTGHWVEDGDERYQGTANYQAPGVNPRKRALELLTYRRPAVGKQIEREIRRGQRQSFLRLHADTGTTAQWLFGGLYIEQPWLQTNLMLDHRHDEIALVSDHFGYANRNEIGGRVQLLPYTFRDFPGLDDSLGGTLSKRTDVMNGGRRYDLLTVTLTPNDAEPDQNATAIYQHDRLVPTWHRLVGVISPEADNPSKSPVERFTFEGTTRIGLYGKYEFPSQVLTSSLILNAFFPFSRPQVETDGHVNDRRKYSDPVGIVRVSQ